MENRYAGMKMTPRISELLDLATICCVEDSASIQGDTDSIRSGMKNVFVDVSQNPIRLPWTNPGSQVTKCLTTGSQLYSFELDRAVVPLEMFFFQGHGSATRISEKNISITVAGLSRRRHLHSLHSNFDTCPGNFW